MDDDGGGDDLQQTIGFTSEDFSELNDIINLTTTSSIEEISELYKSFNSKNDNAGKQQGKGKSLPLLSSHHVSPTFNAISPSLHPVHITSVSEPLQSSYAKAVQCTKVRNVGISVDQPSSMIGTLLSNSFHVLKEAQPSSGQPDTIIPPDKANPPSEGISDTHIEDVTDYESPSTPVSHPIDVLSDDLLAFGGTRKQQKKAAKADFGGPRKQHKKAAKAERKRSSKHKREF